MPPERSFWTILDVIQWTTSFLSSHEVESPRLSAEILLAHVLGANRLNLYLDYGRPLSADELAAFRSLIKRRARREPVAYITGEKAFWNMTFEVGPEVLVPRPDTECLVENALKVLSGAPSAPGEQAAVWEPATGCGAVILSLAAENPDGRFFASDSTPAALRVARNNAVRQGLEGRVDFFASDWFAGVKKGGPGFDLIPANPPYVPAAEIEHLAPEIRNYEPVGALDGGPDGLRHLRHLIGTGADFLKPGGILLLEIGWDQRNAVKSLAEATGHYGDIFFVRDLAGHDRVVRLRKKTG